MRFEDWDDEVHDDLDQVTRQDRARNEYMRIISIDRKSKEATIQAGDHRSVYHVTMHGCSCPDFKKRELPCKHMYRLEASLPVSKKNKKIMMILTIFLGFLGVHRFYAGKIGTGILWLCSGGVFFVGWIADIVAVCKNNFADSSDLLITSEAGDPVE